MVVSAPCREERSSFPYLPAREKERQTRRKKRIRVVTFSGRKREKSLPSEEKRNRGGGGLSVGGGEKGKKT